MPGLLNRWTRSTDGRGFNRVNFEITDRYRVVVAEHESALVPAAVLSPRDEERYRQQTREGR
jgi:hypothetical protein